MRHEQNRAMQPGAELSKPVLHIAARDDIQCAKWLIQKINPRLTQRRTKKSGALAHTAGELIRIFIFTSCQPETRHLPKRRLAHLFFLMMNLSVQADIIQNRPPLKQQVVLRHIRQLPARSPYRHVIDPDLSALRL